VRERERGGGREKHLEEVVWGERTYHKFFKVNFGVSIFVSTCKDAIDLQTVVYARVRPYESVKYRCDIHK